MEGGTLLGSGSADDVTVNTGVLLTGDDGLHTGDLTLAATGTARFEIPASDESFNPLQVAGTVALGGATLDLAALGANTPGRVTLINNDGTADGVVGIFGVATEGSNVLLGGATYTISYVGGDGNDVVLTRTFTSAVNIATGGKTATFTDLDGDKVTVKVTKGELLQKDFVLRDAGIGAQLELLDLTAPGFAGAAVTIISARQGGGGDGSVNVGYINAFGNDLASVTVDGDLGAIDAGDLTATTSGLKALTAQSMGVFGLSTGGPDLASFIRGKLDKATIRGSIVGAVLSSPSIGAITVSGSVVGTTADNSGQISGFSSLGSVTVGGSLIGGGGLFSGAILGPFKSVTIAGDVLGGSGDSSGSLQAFADVGTLKIGGDLRAGSGFGSGSFYLFNNFAASVSIGGSLFGSASGASGSIDVKSAGTISIAGDMNDSARVQVATTAKSITIGGSVFGSYIGSQLNPVGDIGTLKIGGSITQGAAQFGNNGISAKSITTLSVDGSIVGEEAGVEVNDALGAASITGSIVGATVRADSIASLTLGGSLVGLNFGSSGEIEARTGSIGSLKITGDLRESSTGAGGRVLVPAGNLGSFSLGGSVFGGAISVAGDIGAMTVGGSLRNADITAGALSSPTAGADLVLKSLAVKGSVENSRIFAGYSAGFSALNADAQIGAVTVGGDWIASDLVAGVQANGGGFGNADDGKIVGGINDANLHSKIASLVIKGQALGTAAAGDHFGIVAQEIGSVKVGAITYPLTKLPFNDDLDANDPLLLIGATNDFRVHEVAL